MITIVATILITASTYALSAVATQPREPADSPKGSEPANSADLAKTLPPIPQKDGVVSLPLAVQGPLAWRGIRPGVTVAAAEPTVADKLAAVKVSYTRTRKQPAGAALLIRPGTLAGLKHLDILLRSTRTQRLSVCLKDTAGIVWTLPTINARADQESAVVLDLTDIEPDAFQNSGRITAKFDPATVMMVTILDIGGYLSLDEPACEWTVTSVKAVCK